MRFLLLRLEAPLMAFGGTMVDAIGPTRAFPGQAQICGLLANALGYRHQDAARLDALQHRLRLAVALIEPGERLRDYQTVDLGQPHLVGTGWTTRGAIEGRAGASSEATHIRQRRYLADARVLIALALNPPDPAPTLEDLHTALLRPARPLFIGRKHCLPTAPITLGLAEAADAQAALHQAMELLHQAMALLAPPNEQHRRLPRSARPILQEYDRRLLPASGSDAETETERLVDGRDWRNQMHTRERAVARPAWRPAP